MSGPVTVIGLVPGSFVIEDIRIEVPFQTPVQIPAHLAQRSRNLGEAIQSQRIMQLGNVLPPRMATPAKAPPLAPILRGRGIAPHAPVGTHQGDGSTWQRERDSMLREIEASRAYSSQLQGMNDALQAALANMTGQLSQIQQTLGQMSLAPAAGTPRGSVRAPEAAEAVVNEAIPHFIPATAQDVAEVRISIPETTSDSDLSDARGALRSLRNKPGP